MQTLVNPVVDEVLVVPSAATVVSNVVKAVDVAFASTSVRRVDNVPACTAEPIAPTAPSPKARIIWKIDRKISTILFFSSKK